MPSLSTLALVLLVGAVQGSLTPTYPGGDGVVFTAGSECTFSYNLCTDGTWTSFAVDLYTGSNLDMVNVTRVASGIDGTVGSGTYSYICPDVTPNAPIYFYQFSQDRQPSLWTSRFTIAAANGSTTAAENASQPDGSPVAWGIGALSINTTDELTSGPLLPWGSNGVSVATSTVTSTSTSWSATQTGTTTVVDNGAINGFIEAGACSAASLCPQSSPCCSEWGFCGTGRNCLAGCNPLSSFQPGACAPIPACQSTEYKFTADTKARMVNGSTWNGDGVDYDWIVDSQGSSATDIIADNQLLLSLTEANGGTRISSTHSVLYGNVSAKIKSASGAGIVTAFILMSGPKDEIDWEFTTNSTTSAATNYFWEGDVGDYTSGLDVNVTDRSADFRNYAISWTPDLITWSIDDVPVRNITKESTLDAATGIYRFPQTPSRIQISIWPAGLASAAQGTIDWSGGLIDWTAASYTDAGYYASYVQSVSLNCYDSSLLPSSSGTSTTVDGQPTVVTTTSAPADGGASTTAWWTPTQTVWWTPGVVPTTTAPSRKRRIIEFLRRRAEAVAAYTYGALDATGQPTVSVTNSATVLSDATSTGLDIQGSPNTLPVQNGGSSVNPQASSQGANSDVSASATGTGMNSGSASASVTGSATSSSSTESGTSKPTVQQNWDSLSTAAHIGIYIGGALLALLIVVIVGYLWNKAASSRKVATAQGGHYAQIGDQGEMVQTGPIYTGTNEIIPGQLYDQPGQGQAPYGGAAAAAAAASAGAGVTRKPTFVGGYVPSRSSKGQYIPPPELTAQYGTGYQSVSSQMAAGQPRY